MIARQDARDSLALTLHGADAPLVAYAVGQPVEAYALLRLERLSSDMATTQRVAEMAWATPRGWRAMIEALGMIAANADALDWHEPAGGPGLALHAERKMTVQGWLPPMYRVLDVPAALRALEPDPAVAGAFTLTIEDDVLGENIGPWRVAFAGGKVAVESAGTEAGADLTMPIGAFTQALLGQPDLAALEAAGAVVVANPTAYAAARRLLPAHSTYCIDFF
jgi:predicted acetyltransferase